MGSLSCYVLTFNSERRLAQVLGSVHDLVDDLVIVDSGSVDRTTAIASQFGARVVYRKFDNFSSQRTFALHLCKFQWVLELDSDEVVSAELRERLAHIKSHDFNPSGLNPDGFGITREWYFLGKKVHCFYPIRCPDLVVRLYRRDRVGYSASAPIHESARGHRRVEPIREPVLHYTCDSVEQMYAKLNQYTTLSALEMHQRGDRSNWVKVNVYPWLLWAKFFLLSSGWRDGRQGVIHGKYVRDTIWLKYVKLAADMPQRGLCQPLATLESAVDPRQNTDATIHKS
jgi:glycosyltransferase involved in cell wall biosynthesis